MNIMPTNCPFCKNPLLNLYLENDKILQKTCDKRVDHNVCFGSTYWTTKHNLISYISTEMHGLNLRAIWYPDMESFLFNKSGGGDIRMAYFIPDLTNYPKLIKKLKTYLTFL